MTPARTITADAPIRICDIGGWTDTWAARHGQVLNIAVAPVVSVRIDTFARGTRDAPVMVDVANYQLRYAPALTSPTWGPHPLLEAALRTIRPPDDLDIEVSIRSEAPPGAATGTSAAVVVALLAALDRLTGGRRSRAEIAAEAHRVETERLGQLSGVQDQFCSACGGVTFIEIDDYPHAIASAVPRSADTTRELERRLLLFYLGRPHRSSTVHEQVMQTVAGLGARCRPLDALREAAVRAREAIASGDLAAFGRAMSDNTAAQADLHPDLVHRDAWRLSEIAGARGALGWKVNGAGGDGGSVTVLCGSDPDAAATTIATVERDLPTVRAIPIRLHAAGVTVTEADAIDR